MGRWIARPILTARGYGSYDTGSRRPCNRVQPQPTTMHFEQLLVRTLIELDNQDAAADEDEVTTVSETVSNKRRVKLLIISHLREVWQCGFDARFFLTWTGPHRKAVAQQYAPRANELPVCMSTSMNYVCLSQRIHFPAMYPLRLLRCSFEEKNTVHALLPRSAQQKCPVHTRAMTRA